jgi:pimeloyl-ACP methyl ester carboxylesterase
MEHVRAPKRRGRGCLVWLGGFVVAVLGLMLVGSIWESVTEAADVRAYPPPGQLVDMGGYRLHINCAGTGSPTVVVDAGLGDWSTAWSWVQPEVAKTARICTYDRAGYGWSDAGPRPRTAQQFAKELHALLQHANIPGPYILVGHSLAGYTMRVFAHDYATEVAGVVLVDTTSAEPLTQEPADPKPQAESQSVGDAIVPTLARFGLMRLLAGLLNSGEHLPPEAAQAQFAFAVRPQYFKTVMDELRGVPQSMAQTRAALTLGDLPLIVLSRRPGDQPDEKVWQAKQTDLLRLSSHSQQLFADKSGHNIELDQPEAVTAAIVQMVEQVR